MPVKEGDYVLINYTIKVIDPETGEEKVFETTKEEVAKEAGIYDEKRGYRPVWVRVSRENLLDAVYEALIGLEEGEKREIEAPPEKAYGPYRPELVVKVPVKRLRSSGIVPRVGEKIRVEGREGVIKRVTDRFAYIDFNHPLAGKTLKIEVEVLKIAKSDLELAKGIAETLFKLGNTVLDVKVEEEGDKLIVYLPSEVLLISSLEALLQYFLKEIYDKTKYNKVEIRMQFEFRREEEQGEAVEEESSEATSGEGASAEDTKETEASSQEESS